MIVTLTLPLTIGTHTHTNTRTHLYIQCIIYSKRISNDEMSSHVKQQFVLIRRGPAEARNIMHLSLCHR